MKKRRNVQTDLNCRYRSIYIYTYTYTDWSTLKQKSAMLLFDGICNMTVDVYVRRKQLKRLQ